jgi:hypothetical protein
LISAKQVDKKFGKANRAPFPRPLRSTAVRNPPHVRHTSGTVRVLRTSEHAHLEEDGAVFLNYLPRLVSSSVRAYTSVSPISGQQGLPTCISENAQSSQN